MQYFYEKSNIFIHASNMHPLLKVSFQVFKTNKKPMVKMFEDKKLQANANETKRFEYF